jgi:hypothetical protein
MTPTGNMKKGNVKKRAVGKPGLANSDDYARAIIARKVSGVRAREGCWEESAPKKNEIPWRG